MGFKLKGEYANIPIDPATNMPVLPEGYHWRVRDYSEDMAGVYDCLEVSVMRKRKVFNLFKMRKVEKTRQYTRTIRYNSKVTEDIADPGWEIEDTVLWLACYLFNQHRYTLAPKAKTPTELEIAKVVGDYPPKKLEI